MGNRISIPIGTRYGRVVTLNEVEKRNNRRSFLCLCDCGENVVLRLENLRSGHSQSCGCLHRDVSREVKTTHGKYGTRAYWTWSTMKARCENPKNKKYHRYGSRGITVCHDWLKFANFYRDMGDPPDGMSIDRIDNDKGYFLENCRWATQAEQGNNKSTNVVITLDGITKTMSQWAFEKGINVQTVHARVKKGWKVEDIFSSVDGSPQSKTHLSLKSNAPTIRSV